MNRNIFNWLSHKFKDQALPQIFQYITKLDKVESILLTPMSKSDKHCSTHPERGGQFLMGQIKNLAATKYLAATLLMTVPAVVNTSCEQKEVAPKVLSEVESMTPQQWVEKNGYILERDFYLNDSKNIGHMTYKVVKGEKYYMLAPENFEVNLDVYRDYKKTVVDRVLQATGGKEDVSDDMRYFFNINFGGESVRFEFPNDLINSEVKKLLLSERYLNTTVSNNAGYDEMIKPRRPINQNISFVSQSNPKGDVLTRLEQENNINRSNIIIASNGSIKMGK